MNGHHPSPYSYKVLAYCVIFTKATLSKPYSAGMKERCRDGCRTSLLIAGVVLVPAIFHTLLPPCHPYITIHFMEIIFSTCGNHEWSITGVTVVELTEHAVHFCILPMKNSQLYVWLSIKEVVCDGHIYTTHIMCKSSYLPL